MCLYNCLILHLDVTISNGFFLKTNAILHIYVFLIISAFIHTQT